MAASLATVAFANAIKVLGRLSEESGPHTLMALLRLNLFEHIELR
jgi:hypothetical protein